MRDGAMGEGVVVEVAIEEGKRSQLFQRALKAGRSRRGDDNR